MAFFLSSGIFSLYSFICFSVENTKASAALSDNNYLILAKKNHDFILKNFITKEDSTALKHSYKNNIAKHPAFLDDYALLIKSCIHLQELTAESKYLILAKSLTSKVIRDFRDEKTDFFFFTGKDQKDVIVRKKEIYDGATGSGNSIMAENLFYLSVIFNKKDWQRLAKKITGSIKTAVVKHPGSFCIWASVLLNQFHGLKEIVITGPGYENILNRLLQQYLPGTVIQCCPVSNNQFPLLAGKNRGSKTLIFLCKNYSCKTPVETLENLFLQLEKPFIN